MKTRLASGKSAAAPDIATTPDPLLQESLREYQDRHKLTQDALGRRLGYNGTYVSRYYSASFAGDLAMFEQAITSLLENESSAVQLNDGLVDHSFSVESVSRFLRHVKAHGFIGIGHGKAGRGKTCGARLFASANPGTIYVHVVAWMSGRYQVRDEILRQSGGRVGKAESRDAALVRILRGSGRLIILDNAQRLTESARRWLADLHDTTSAPLALIGNPEILAQWERNDQHGSRVGLCRDITTDLDAAETARELLRLHLPAAAANPAALKQAEKITAGFGSCRALKMHARLADVMIQGGNVTDPAEALRLASTQLVHAA